MLNSVREEAKTTEVELRATLAARDAAIAALEEAVETHKGATETHVETHKAAMEATVQQHEAFVKTAKEWTAEYASEKKKDEKMSKLMEMGFGEAVVRNALSRAAGDEQQALELLLTGL